MRWVHSPEGSRSGEKTSLKQTAKGDKPDGRDIGVGTMNCLRAFIRSHARLTLALLAVALAVKALVPAGFMIGASGDRFLTVTICSDATGVPKQMQIAIPDKDGGDHAEAADKGQPCAFAGLGHAGLTGTDPVLLAAAIAFILLIGLAPLPALPSRETPFLRPPLRGPPSPSV